ncbi:FimB/Mfa2 family fimbrial subunit [Dysgonomonas sp. ZJ709]|uniref:FimB/Mfa2 family fimbrial subunit n=1 Tax=Dysgonomonas sp. ZJ709 TaxID=2709797 RepID=UPI0013EDA89A|nr:FimB/Mfa2 family fimbrial subunit [Dysgonomonas sp. ZJ709]
MKYLIFARKLKYCTILLFVSLCFSACIYDDFPTCDTTLSMNIKAVNPAGQDITSSGEAGGAHVYIFDKNQRFVQEIAVSANDIQNKVPVKIFYKGRDSFSVVVWSNLNGKQEVSSLNEGISMDQALVQLKRDTEAYAQNPDDLFYGITNIKERTANADVTIEDNVTIHRKTALVNIMVKGLDAPVLASSITKAASDYHFIITGTKEDAYNFKGNLTGNSITYNQGGEFNDSNTQFISYPFTMYPLSDGNRLTIAIYKGDTLIAIAETNSDGTDIIPIIGGTINILIDLRGSLTVNIKVTDWDNEYHWFEW